MGPRTTTIALAFSLVLPGVAFADPPRQVLDFTEEAELDPDKFLIDDAVYHTPQVGYVLTRQEQDDLEQLSLKEPFVPKILSSVEDRPF